MLVREDLLSPELLDQYVRRCVARNLSRNTVRLYRLAVEKLIQTYPNKPLHEFTPEHIERHIFDRPIGPRSQAQELRYLRVFFKRLVEQRLLPENPCQKAQGPAWKPRRRKAPSFADFQALHRQARNLTERVLVMVYFYTALRLQEVLNLHIRDIDVGEREILVVKGKGDEDRVVVFDPEGLPEDLRLAPLLRQYMDGRGPDDWLFASRLRPQYHRDRNWANRTLRTLGKLAGLPYPVTTHLLRHGWARWAKKSGLPISLAQKQLGHKDIRTTDRIYGEVDTSDLKQGMDKFLHVTP